MGKHEFKAFIKNLTKNKVYSLITVFGFAFSLMFVILLSTYIKGELSVDKFHENKDRIYRLSSENNCNFAPPIGNLIQTTYPEIESYTRLFNQTGIISYKENNKIGFEFLLADSTFFSIFSFPLVKGDAKEVLKLRKSIVLSESFARKLFGDIDPVGKVVTINSDLKFTVTGIMKDLPQNTHIKQCESIINFSDLSDIWGWKNMENDFSNSSFGLYLLKKENTDLQSKAADMVKLFKENFWVYRNGYANEVLFIPLKEAYFDGHEGSCKRYNSKNLLIILSAISGLILLLAIINYVNLTIAQGTNRGKESAVKKLLGSSKFRLIKQFIAESMIVCLVALLIALLLCQLFVPIFENLLDTELFLFENINFLSYVYIISLVLLVGFLSGILPALFIAKFHPIEVVKGSFQNKVKTSYSKALIAFQYTIAIVLLISTFMITKQTKFMLNYNIGFNKENIFRLSNVLSSDQKDAFKGELMKIPGVEKVAYVAGSPVDGGNNSSFQYFGEPVSFQVFLVDTCFFSMFGIKYKTTGTAYSNDVYFLNETAIKKLDIDPLPTSFNYYNRDVPVYAVVEDFHFNQLHEKIGPAMIRPLHKNSFAWDIFIKITGVNQYETVDKIKTAYHEFTHGLPFEYGFVDETINQWYKKEEKTARIIGYFTILAVILSMLGILAMATYYIQQKIKEIGIRKVNGARIYEVIQMLNMDFIKWVIVSIIFAYPLAWLVVQKWLQNFPYRTDISWWVFIVAGAITLGIAILTVSWQSLRAASRNPVEALRYE